MKMLGVAAIFLIAVQVASCSSFDPGNVKFFLYNYKYAEHPVELRKGFNADNDNTIEPSKMVKFLCHGYTDNSTAYWIAPTKNAFMQVGDMNVISVDWSKYAFSLYPTSAEYTVNVGEVIAHLIIDMHERLNVPYENFHLIGHSLGSHVFGFAGKKVFELTGEKVGRITGLDPAGPGFNGNTAEHRLSSEDAQFVDALHTDTSILGYKKSIAHADFWPNGGASQNGCSVLSSCSHVRAPIYFAESIGNGDFLSWECDSIKNLNSGKCVNNRKMFMGDSCNTSARGNYYLVTNKKSPFAVTH